MPPQKGETRRCIVLPETSPKGRPYLKVAEDPGIQTRGVLVGASPGSIALAPGMLIECRVTSVAPRGHDYVFLKLA